MVKSICFPWLKRSWDLRDHLVWFPRKNPAYSSPQGESGTSDISTTSFGLQMGPNVSSGVWLLRVFSLKGGESRSSDNFPQATCVCTWSQVLVTINKALWPGSLPSKAQHCKPVAKHLLDASSMKERCWWALGFDFLQGTKLPHTKQSSSTTRLHHRF